MKYILIILLVFLALPTFSQEDKIKTTRKRDVIKKEDILNIELTLADVRDIELYNESDTFSNRPFRFAKKVIPQKQLKSKIRAEKVDNGQLYILKVKGNNKTLNLNAVYKSFHLPPGAELYIYNKDKSIVYGPYTEKHNQGSRSEVAGFATPIIPGNSMVIEYYEPNDVEHEGIVELSSINCGVIEIPWTNFIGQDSIIPETPNNGLSGPCQVDINCSEGNAYQTIKSSVAMYTIDGTDLCTGTLLNTTVNSYSSHYFLTAYHCMTGVSRDAVTNPSISSLVVYWDVEDIGCGTGTFTMSGTTNGGYLVASASVDNTSQSDFALISLTESPLDRFPNMPRFYSGWDRGAPGAGGVGIHHPQLDVKKIATHDQVPSEAHPDGVRYWRVNFDPTANGHSVTEGGSSGSALFNQYNLVIGQLYGGSGINCTNPFQDWSIYGKLGWSFNSSIYNNRSLNIWLDPNEDYPMRVYGQLKCKRRMYSEETYTGNEHLTGCDIQIDDVVIGSNVSVNAVNQVIILNDFTIGNGRSFTIE
jgi:hypothetical protein